MQYYMPSIPAIECPPLVPDDRPILVCPSCGDAMQHLRTIPKLGAREIMPSLWHVRAMPR
jgi:hypothetical protein